MRIIAVVLYGERTKLRAKGIARGTNFFAPIKRKKHHISWKRRRRSPLSSALVTETRHPCFLTCGMMRMCQERVLCARSRMKSSIITEILNTSSIVFLIFYRKADTLTGSSIRQTSESCTQPFIVSQVMAPLKKESIIQDGSSMNGTHWYWRKKKNTKSLNKKIYSHEKDRYYISDHRLYNHNALYHVSDM